MSSEKGPPRAPAGPPPTSVPLAHSRRPLEPLGHLLAEELAAHAAPEPRAGVGGPLAPRLFQRVQAAALQGLAHRLQAAVGLRQDVCHAGGSGKARPDGEPACGASSAPGTGRRGGAGRRGSGAAGGRVGAGAASASRRDCYSSRAGKRMVRGLRFLLPLRPPSPETPLEQQRLAGPGQASGRPASSARHSARGCRGAPAPSPPPVEEVTQKRRGRLPPPKHPTSRF